MKVIFLDIDGVLNTMSTKEEIEGYTFVSDGKVALLKELIDQTGAKLVLSSTWRRGWYCKERLKQLSESDKQDIRRFEALCKKLHEFGIELMDYTDDFGLRGQEIDAWLKAWQGEPIEAYVILDDMCGTELRPHAQYLIQTSLSGGMNEKHVQCAIKLLNTKNNKRNIQNDIFYK